MKGCVLSHGRFRGRASMDAGGVGNSTEREALLSIMTRICVACPRGPPRLDFGPMSRTFLATLHYDGTGFVGWQRQPAGRSVQVEFEAVLERLFEHRTVAHASGRTDAGVHAQGIGASFEAPSHWPSLDLHRALNALLPRDCWVESVCPMRPGFHARKSATSRRYRYDIGLDAASASPFRRPFEWAFGRPLNVAWLQSAARAVLGPHDFSAFAAKGTPKPHYHCTLTRSEWTERPDGRGVSFHVEADRFLHHMVRMLVGTMVDIGAGRRPPEDIGRLLANGDNQETSPPAPPHGLYFVAATYPPELFAQSPDEEAHALARSV
jgi:tRNA pseudouridine38-40 synthase